MSVTKGNEHGHGEGKDVLSEASALPCEKAENAEAPQAHRGILSLALTPCTHMKYLHGEIPTEIHLCFMKCDPKRTQGCLLIGFQNGLRGKRPKNHLIPPPSSTCLVLAVSPQ